jgi:hypothetical protein
LRGLRGALREQALARLLEQREATERQAVLSPQDAGASGQEWTYDPARDQFTHADGRVITGIEMAAAGCRTISEYLAQHHQRTVPWQVQVVRLPGVSIERNVVIVETDRQVPTSVASALFRLVPPSVRVEIRHVHPRRETYEATLPLSRIDTSFATYAAPSWMSSPMSMYATASHQIYPSLMTTYAVAPLQVAHYASRLPTRETVPACRTCGQDVCVCTWTTRDGRVVNVVDMPDAHLYNAINVRNRRGGLGSDQRYAPLVREAQRRGWYGGVPPLPPPEAPAGDAPVEVAEPAPREPLGWGRAIPSAIS